MAAGGELHTRRRWGRWGLGLGTALLVLGAGIVALPTQSGSERPTQSGTGRPIVPTQWIAKQYSELLGRSPTAAEWTASVAAFESASRCSADSLSDMGRDLAGSDEFAASYPEQTPLDKAQRFTAVIRATLSRDPHQDDWDELFVPYREGEDSWPQVLDAVYGASRFEDALVPAICDGLEPAYGFGAEGNDYEPPVDLRELSDDGASRTQQQLQDAIDAAGAAGGGTVELAPGELIRIGGAENGDRQLVIAPGVTLTTAGAPGTRQYARMGRLVPNGPNATICVEKVCSNVAMVRVAPGGGLTNVWVEGTGLDAAAFKIAAIESSGSSDAQPTRLVGNRVSVPARDGVGIRARGFSLSGEPCTAEVIADNLVTGYASAQSFDGRGQAMWSDGIAVGCESARVTGNQLIDISDAGIVLYGSFNRALASMRAQTSSVSGNQLLSAGLPGHVALGFDAIGECSAFPSGGVVPCLDVPTERDFHGSSISSNTYSTGPRTHFDIGLMVGGGARWGAHRVPATGASASDNTTGRVGARVNIGIAVLAMADATLSNNTGALELVDGNPLSKWGKCPRAEITVGSTELPSLTITPSATLKPNDTADGCLIGEPSPDGLDLLKVGLGGDFLVTESGARFTPWGMR
ncbi:MAG: hypothetical protein ACRDV7_00660, partial [Acidimicrobiia bacterium]